MREFRILEFAGKTASSFELSRGVQRVCCKFLDCKPESRICNSLLGDRANSPNSNSAGEPRREGRIKSETHQDVRPDRARGRGRNGVRRRLLGAGDDKHVYV